LNIDNKIENLPRKKSKKFKLGRQKKVLTIKTNNPITYALLDQKRRHQI
jgi:hypothetical protein